MSKIVKHFLLSLTLCVGFSSTVHAWQGYQQWNFPKETISIALVVVLFTITGCYAIKKLFFSKKTYEPIIPLDRNGMLEYLTKANYNQDAICSCEKFMMADETKNTWHNLLKEHYLTEYKKELDTCAEQDRAKKLDLLLRNSIGFRKNEHGYLEWRSCFSDGSHKGYADLRCQVLMQYACDNKMIMDKWLFKTITSNSFAYYHLNLDLNKITRIENFSLTNTADPRFTNTEDLITANT